MPLKRTSPTSPGDTLWQQIEPLLPPRKPHPLCCHNPRAPDRNAILFVLRTGCQWNSLDATEICSCSSAYRRFREWSEYITSVDAIEGTTLDLFSNLSKEIQDVIEAKKYKPSRDVCYLCQVDSVPKPDVGSEGILVVKVWLKNRGSNITQAKKA